MPGAGASGGLAVGLYGKDLSLLATGLHLSSCSYSSLSGDGSECQKETAQNYYQTAHIEKRKNQNGWEYTPASFLVCLVCELIQPLERVRYRWHWIH